MTGGGSAGDMALLQALMQLDGDAGVGLAADNKNELAAEPEQGRCLRARHVAAHDSCSSTSECPEVGALIL